MALQSMTALASITLQEATASVSFSGIPQNYRDLVLVFNGTISLSSPARGAEFYFNADETAGNYSYVWAYGDSVGAGSASGSPQLFTVTNSQSTAVIQVIDYSATNKHKTSLTRSNAGAIETDMLASRWANTAAITSLLIKDASAGFTFAAGSTFNLYGRIG